MQQKPQNGCQQKHLPFSPTVFLLPFTSLFPNLCSLLSSLCYLFPLPSSSSRSLPCSFGVFCQRVLQCWYSVKGACQQLDLSLDPVHIPSTPSLWSYFNPDYRAQKGIHLINFLCFYLKVAWASHCLIRCFIILLAKIVPVSTPLNLLTRQEQWLLLKLNRLYHPVTHFFLQSHLFRCLYSFIQCSFTHLQSHQSRRPGPSSTDSFRTVCLSSGAVFETEFSAASW